MFTLIFTHDNIKQQTW